MDYVNREMVESEKLGPIVGHNHLLAYPTPPINY